MIRRQAAVGGLLLLVLVLQSTLVPHLAIWGTLPDLVLIAVIMVGLARGPAAGVLAGLFVGFAGDLLRGRELGLLALGQATAGGLAGLAAERVYPGLLQVPLAVGMIATVVDQLLVVGIYAANRGQISLAAAALLPIARQAVYNGVLAVLVFGLWERRVRSRGGGIR